MDEEELIQDIDLIQQTLSTFKGQNIPEVVDGFFCYKNYLTSLEFGPKEASLYYADNNELTSLEFCATKISKSLSVDGNLLTNLKDIHKHFKNGYICHEFALKRNPLKSHLLGIILIPKLDHIVVSNFKVQDIFNKHLETGRDVLDCQEELIQNSLKEFAQL